MGHFKHIPTPHCYCIDGPIWISFPLLSMRPMFTSHQHCYDTVNKLVLNCLFRKLNLAGKYLKVHRGWSQLCWWCLFNSWICKWQPVDKNKRISKSVDRFLTACSLTHNRLFTFVQDMKYIFVHWNIFLWREWYSYKPQHAFVNYETVLNPYRCFSCVIFMKESRLICV